MKKRATGVVEHSSQAKIIRGEKYSYTGVAAF
jgi:hypothetical protein